MILPFIGSYDYIKANPFSPQIGNETWDHIDIRGNGGRINLNQQSIKETIENWLPIN